MDQIKETVLDSAETMTAVVTTGHGGLEKLELRQVPVPQPAPGEVLVKVAACGINNTEIWGREGRYGTEDDPNAIAASGRTKGNFPLIQGVDIVGTIVALGAGVDPARMGERVIVDFILHIDGPDGVTDRGGMGSRRDGGYAEYCALPQENAFAVNSDWSDAELATLPCAYTTAANMLAQADVPAGSLIAVSGVSGGVGSALIQLAHARGLRVVAITRGHWAEEVRALGPEKVVVGEGNLWPELKAALGDERVAASFDVVAGDLVTPMLNALAPKGTYIVSGASGAPMATIDVRTLYGKRLTVKGVSLGTRESFAEVLSALEAGKLKPLLARTFPLKDLREAHTFFKSKQYFGKLVVLP